MRHQYIQHFKRTILKNYHAVKLDITDPGDIQSAFVTALPLRTNVNFAICHTIAMSYQVNLQNLPVTTFCSF